MCPCRPTASLKGQGEAFSANGLFRLRIGLFGQRVNRAVRLLDFGVVKSGAYLRAHTVKIFFAQQRLLPELLRGLSNYRMLIYAILLIAMMLFNNSSLKKRMLEKRGMKQMEKLERAEKSGKEGA